jgi:hypothetical protein
VGIADHEQAQMRSQAEAEEGEVLLERRKWNLCSRLARQRAAYFADIEEVGRMPDIDRLLPEACLALAEQSTRPGWIIEQPTGPLPADSHSVLHYTRVWRTRWPAICGLWRHTRSRT